MPEERFDFAAIGGDVSHYGLLSPRAVEKWKELEGLIHSRWTSPDDLKSSAVSIAGCLEKLGASLLQAHRMKGHHDGLLTIAREMRKKPALAAFKGAEACADFESMLLQGRATLDRLTWFVSQEFRNKTTSFPRLRTVLGQFKHQPTATRLVRLLEEADEWFDGTYGQLSSSSSLRDLVAHFHSLTEGTRSCFGVTYLDERRCLLLDCEVALPPPTEDSACS